MGRGEYFRAKYGGGGRGRGRGRGRGDHGYTYPGDSQQPFEEPSVILSDGEGGEHEPSTLASRGDAQALHHTLMRIDGKGYKAYNDICGTWNMQQGAFTLCIDYVQSDPFAPPSNVRVQLPPHVAGFPKELYRTKIRRVALADYIARAFKATVSHAGADIRRESSSWGGEKGGEMTIDAGGQHVLERTSVIVDVEGGLEARFTVALPAKGRSVLGGWAAAILTQNLPKYVAQSLRYEAQDKARLKAHVHCAEDTEALRQQITSKGFIAFVGNGAVLPRASGASDQPMTGAGVIAFQSPPSMQVTVNLPNRGPVSGMAIQQGVTLIVGGGFHGKSTLLKALEAGITNKVLGDGRELVVTAENATKIRAEDGRRVEGVDISPFISNLPFGRTTNDFRSDDASGSTSQAANIMEALEMGSCVLLIDEDTTATNFMIRDARMQALVSNDKEPITPLVAKIKAMSKMGASCILVIGGSGDYFEVADRVVAMDCYSAKDVTQQAKQIAHQSQSIQHQGVFGQTTARSLRSVLPSPGVKVRVRDIDAISFGDVELDLACVEQIFDKSQTRSIAESLVLLSKRINLIQWRDKPLLHVLSELDKEISVKGLDVLSTRRLGNLARPRMLEVAAALNRLRCLAVRQCGCL